MELSFLPLLRLTTHGVLDPDVPSGDDPARGHMDAGRRGQLRQRHGVGALGFAEPLLVVPAQEQLQASLDQRWPSPCSLGACGVVQLTACGVLGGAAPTVQPCPVMRAMCVATYRTCP